MSRLFPAFVSLQVINACDSRCVFCPGKSLRGSFPHAYMSEVLMEQILAEIARHRDQVEEIDLNLHCEPTLDFRLVSLCRWLSDFGYPPQVITNGSRIHDHDLDELVRYTSLIQFSMHGGRDAGRRERYMSGLDHEQCYRNVEAMGQAIKRSGRLVTLRVTDMFCPGPEEEAQGKRWAELAGCENFEFVRPRLLQRALAVDLGVRAGPRVTCGSLCGPHRLGGILWDGTMIVCSADWQQQYSPGRIYDDGTIEDLFNSEVANRLRWESSGEVDLPEDHICRRCCAVPPLEALPGKRK